MQGLESVAALVCMDWCVNVGLDCVEASLLQRWQRNAEVEAASGVENVHKMCFPGSIFDTLYHRLAIFLSGSTVAVNNLPPWWPWASLDAFFCYKKQNM